MQVSDAFLMGKYPCKHEKARGDWTRSKTKTITIRHLENIDAPLILLLKILSGSIIEVATMLITRVLHRVADTHKVIEGETD